jgi:hypothetical protein
MMIGPKSYSRLLLSCLLPAIAIAAGVPLAFAEHQPGHQTDHSQHAQESAAPAQQLSEASKAYDQAMQKMHKQMMVPYTNDVDIDFVRGMIPHHQGAIEQAEVLLKYSKNPRLRRLAGGIIAAQKREIRFMEKWMKENAAGVDTGEMPAWMKDAPSTVEDAAKAGAPEKD